MSQGAGTVVCACARLGRLGANLEGVHNRVVDGIDHTFAGSLSQGEGDIRPGAGSLQRENGHVTGRH